MDQSVSRTITRDGRARAVPVPLFAPLRCLIPVVLLVMLCTPDALTQRSGPLFRRIGHEQGLSQSLVLCMLQDHHGFMWIGTEDGLNRYDGYVFETYRHDPSDSTSLSSSHIGCLFEDRQGSLWIGTWGGGLNCLDADHRTFRRFRHDPRDTTSLSHDRVTSIVDDEKGGIWICTAGGGLDRLDPATGKFTHQRSSDTSLPSARWKDQFCSIRTDDGSLWIGTYFSGLVRVDMATGATRVYRHNARDESSLSDDRVLSLCAAADGRLWVGTWEGGLNLLDPTTGRSERFVHDPHDPGSLPGNTVRCVAVDAEGTLWLGTVGAGAAQRRSGQEHFTRITHSPIHASSLSDNVVTAICVDEGGTLWFGTASGLSIHAPTAHRFPLYRSAPGIAGELQGKRVYALSAERDGIVWVGTEDGGLHRFDPRTGSFLQFRHDPSDPRSLPRDYVTALMIDSRGELLVGTYGGGLAVKNRTGPGFRRLGSDPHDPSRRLNAYISALCEDREGRIWVGTWIAGLAVVDHSGRVVRRYVPDPSDPGSIADTDIRALAVDRRGTLWVGTAKAGLSRYDRDSDRFVRVFPQKLNDAWAGTEYVQSIVEDQRGTLWLGTFGGGAVCLDPVTGACARVTKDNGLPNNVVYGIVIDEDQLLWISTNEGLTCFDPSTGRSRSYTHNDGLQADEFNFNAYCEGPDHTLYFGGVNGFNAVAPGRIPENRHVPPVVITGFRVFDRPWDTGMALHVTRAITLDHDANFIAIEYAALDYALPERNQYAYRLEGIDRDWVRAGERRTASYTDLPPGEYVFRVRGSNNDGVWNESGAGLTISVHPPYWQSVWFRLAIGALAAAALVLLYRLRVRSLLKVERLRLRIAADLHDDIGSNLASIAVLADMVRTRANLAPVEVGRLLDISHAARQTTEALRDIVWFVNPDHDMACTIGDRLRGIASTLLAGIDHTFCIEGPVSGSRLSMVFRRDLVLIYKEILSNIVRHAEASHVEIRLTMIRGHFTLEVRDDGKGFECARPTEGNGLMTTRRRAAELGATMTLRSVPGKGTHVVLTGKIP